jgi:hypothetical protein
MVTSCNSRIIGSVPILTFPLILGGVPSRWYGVPCRETTSRRYYFHRLLSLVHAIAALEMGKSVELSASAWILSSYFRQNLIPNGLYLPQCCQFSGECSCISVVAPLRDLASPFNAYWYIAFLNSCRTITALEANNFICSAPK